MSALCPRCRLRDVDEDGDDWLCRPCSADEAREAQAECDTPMGMEDDGGEPADLDSDAGYDPYTGGAEDDGYDRGTFYDDFGCDDF